MQKLKYFFTYSIFSLFAFTGQAQANDIVINKDSLFYPTFSLDNTSSNDNQENSFGINVEEGRYFFTWESSELNQMLTEDYAQNFISKNIEDIHTRPRYKEAIEPNEVRYDITYARRDPVSLNVIPVSYDIPMIFEYKDPINGETKQYRPKELGLNIQISLTGENLQMQKKIPVFHLNKSQKDNLLNRINREDYFKQQYIDAFGAIAFAFQVIPEEQEYYKRQEQRSSQEVRDTQENINPYNLTISDSE